MSKTVFDRVFSAGGCIILGAAISVTTGIGSFEGAFAIPTHPLEVSKNVAVTPAAVGTSAPATCIDPSALTFKIFEQLTAGAAANDFDNWVLEQDEKVVASGDTELQHAMDSQEGEAEGAPGSAYGLQNYADNDNAQRKGAESDDGLPFLPVPERKEDTVGFLPVPQPANLSQGKHVRCCIHTATSEPAIPVNTPHQPVLFYPGYGNNFDWQGFGCNHIIQCESFYKARSNDLGALLMNFPPGVRPGIGNTNLVFDNCVRTGPGQLTIPASGKLPNPAPLKEVMAALGCQDATVATVRHGQDISRGGQGDGHLDPNTAVLASLDMLRAGSNYEVTQLACHTSDNRQLRCEQAQFFRALLASLCQGSGSKLTITGKKGQMMLPIGGEGCSIFNPTGFVGPQNAWNMMRIVITESGWITCKLGLGGWQEDDTYCGNLFKGQGNMTGQPNGRDPKLKCS
jgi:hypothetical protein